VSPEKEESRAKLTKPQVPTSAPPKKQTSAPSAPAPQPTPSSAFIQGNSGGINVQQGTTGENSPIINSPITVGNVPKKISPTDMQRIVQYFLNAKAKSKVEIEADQYSGAAPLPDEFYQAMKDGGWDMKEPGVQRTMALYGPGKLFQGAVVTVNGEPLGPGERIYVNDSNPVFYIGNVLQALNIPRSLTRSKTQPEDLIVINFIGGFP
jgi:hypothetical protein